MFMLFILIFLIPMLLMFIGLILFKSNISNYQMNLPFECGFNPLKSSRTPFSLQFFILAILFLVFDVEITLLLPIPLITSTPISYLKIITLSLFIIILLLGVLIEWYMKILDWIK